MADGINFTQKELASLFGLGRSNISESCRNEPSTIFVGDQKEGRRLIKREIKKYGLGTAYKIALSSKKLSVYEKLCRDRGIDVIAYAISSKQNTFAELLSRFFAEGPEIIREFVLGPYRIDFYIKAVALAIEYDERHHQRPARAQADSQRESALISTYGLSIIRVSEGKEIEGLAEIARFMAQHQCRSLTISG